VRVDHSRTPSRSTAWSSDIRGRSCCLLVARERPSCRPAPLLVSRADPDERQALLAVGHPYFAPRAGGGRIGVWLAGTTYWDEIRELVTESYRVPAPKKPIARLEWAAPPSSPTLMVSPCLGR